MKNERKHLQNNMIIIKIETLYTARNIAIVFLFHLCCMYFGDVPRMATSFIATKIRIGHLLCMLVQIHCPKMTSHQFHGSLILIHSGMFRAVTAISPNIV